MFGYAALTKKVDQWVYDHLQRHDDPEYALLLDRVDYWTAIKKKEKLSPHAQGRKEYGASKAGGCTRAQSLKKSGYRDTPTKAGTRWTWEIGHNMEAWELAFLEAVGVKILASQYEVVIPGLFRSWSDGLIQLPDDLDGETMLLSGKSDGMKASQKQRDKWVRRGFAEIPFMGVQRSEPGWWAQAQVEMYGSPQKIDKELVFVLAKDTIGSMENDPYLLESGSTFCYSEIIAAQPEWVRSVLLPTWRKTDADTKAGGIADAMVLNRDTMLYAKLNPADRNWQPNAGLVGGTFNYCLYCDQFENCAAVTRGVAEDRPSARESQYGSKPNSAATNGVA